MNEKQKIIFLKQSIRRSKFEEVLHFNIAQQSARLSLVDNDMIDEDINDTLLQISMSVPPENTESRQCVAIACLYVSIFTASYTSCHRWYKLQISIKTS